MVPWCVERLPDTGVHLLVEAENKVWGMFGSKFLTHCSLSNLFCNSPLSPFSCSLTVEGRRQEWDFPIMVGGGGEELLTRNT